MENKVRIGNIHKIVRRSLTADISNARLYSILDLTKLLQRFGLQGLLVDPATKK